VVANTTQNLGVNGGGGVGFDRGEHRKRERREDEPGRQVSKKKKKNTLEKRTYMRSTPPWAHMPGTHNYQTRFKDIEFKSAHREKSKNMEFKREREREQDLRT
jgi:hypothetical protein